MDLKINGESKSFSDSASLLALLEQFDVHPDATGVAVALNDVVVPRAQWATTDVTDGDSIEIIRAVQGG